jgi:ferrochelatase
MRDDGVRHAAAFVTSAFGSPPGCRQYLDDITRARAEVGAEAPIVDKLPLYGDHPRFVDVMTERTRAALDERPDGRLVFVAHSIPLAMTRVSPYLAQLRSTCAAIATALGRAEHDLVWQSRSGPPQVPWLEPDINDHLRALADAGCPDGVVIVPIGFVADHMEVAWDLDVQAGATARELEIPFVRAGTAGVHPSFIRLVGDLLIDPSPRADTCGPDCCVGWRRPPLST